MNAIQIIGSRLEERKKSHYAKPEVEDPKLIHLQQKLEEKRQRRKEQAELLKVKNSKKASQQLKAINASKASRLHYAPSMIPHFESFSFMHKDACIFHLLTYKYYVIIIMIPLQHVIEESRWQELEQRQEKLARLTSSHRAKARTS
jgi:hypothetical protein